MVSTPEEPNSYGQNVKYGPAAQIFMAALLGRCSAVGSEARDPDVSPCGPPSGLTAEVYQQLKDQVASIVRGYACPGLLQTTALVHEAWLKLSAAYGGGIGNDGRLAVMAAVAVRSVLVDEARREDRLKRGGAWRRLPLEAVAVQAAPAGPAVDVIRLDRALTELAALSERRASIVELRFFGGLSAAESAAALGVSERTVQAEWEQARAWLRIRLSNGEAAGGC